jgi:pyruvate ferredoxin oxidoreductase alpha subunit
LAKHYANGLIPKYITVESEHSALSALVGASAAGARVLTTTGSQGLLLMHEVLFAASGMRLPIVIVVGNRAVSAPLNIWNDQQDTVSQRDSGWIQFYAESNQEAVDLLPQAFKVAEETMIPVMLNVDAFILTHSVEQIQIPTSEEVSKFLPPYNPPVKLDPENPVSMGVYAAPPHYQEFREDLQSDFDKSLAVIEKVSEEYSKITGVNYPLVDSYKVSDADFVILGMGSAMGNVKAAVDELRREGKKVGACRIRVYRPFPRELLRKELSGKFIGVLERDLSPGGAGPVYLELVEALSGTGSVVSNFTGGLGGREILLSDIKGIFKKLEEKKPVKEWVARGKIPEGV